MKKVLLVIDMLKDFCVAGRVLASDVEGKTYGAGIIPFVVDKVKEFDHVIFICDNHEPEDLEFKRFPIHCVAGTEGAELVEELQPFKDKGPIVTKQRYSGFFNTALEEMIKEYDGFYVVGVCTNICVFYTVEELCNRDQKVFVYEEGVASFDPEAHKFALLQMKNVLGAELI
ncbi:MAG: isochorismatase family cysteine hydrolase [Thermotaleaceae bacterium]